MKRTKHRYKTVILLSFKADPGDNGHAPERSMGGYFYWENKTEYAVKITLIRRERIHYNRRKP